MAAMESKRSSSVANNWNFGSPGAHNLTGRKPYTAVGSRDSHGIKSTLLQYRPSPDGKKARRILNKMPQNLQSGETQREF